MAAGRIATHGWSLPVLLASHRTATHGWCLSALGNRDGRLLDGRRVAEAEDARRPAVLLDAQRVARLERYP